MIQYRRTTEGGGGGLTMQLLFIRGLYVTWRPSASKAPLIRIDLSDSIHLGISCLELECDWFHRSNEYPSSIDR